MAVVASGLMIGAVVTGAVAGHAMGLGDFGTLSYAMGAGVYGFSEKSGQQRRGKLGEALVQLGMGRVEVRSSKSSLTFSELPWLPRLGPGLSFDFQFFNSAVSAPDGC